MGSAKGSPRTGRALALWLLVLAQLGAAAWLAQQFQLARAGRPELAPLENLRLFETGCGAVAGGCLLDPLLLSDGHAAEAVLAALGDGRLADPRAAGARAAAVEYLAREECRDSVNPAALFEQLASSPTEPGAVRRAALAGLQRVTPDVAEQVAGSVGSDDPIFAEALEAVRQGQDLPLHERSAVAALLRLPHAECAWRNAP